MKTAPINTAAVSDLSNQSRRHTDEFSPFFINAKNTGELVCIGAKML